MTLRATSGGEAISVVTVSGSLEAATVTLDGGDPIVSGLYVVDDEEVITVGDRSHRARFRIDGRTTWVWVDGETWPFAEVDVASRTRRSSATSNDVRSPMPGTVVSVRAHPDGVVHAGDALVVVSAMKMEHVLVAPRDGTVDILVREGDSVLVDELVARMVPATSTETSA